MVTWPEADCTDSTVIAQAARPAATPAFAERVTAAAANASANTAVIGISQPKVTAADSGYAHRDPGAWALPLRAAGAQLIQDLHPHDRGPKGTHDGAIISGGSLYCPCTPRLLPGLGPLARDSTREQATTHDTSTAELARYKLGRLTRDDPDGYHRVQCPAAMGKIRCPGPAEIRLCQPSSGRNTSGTPTWPSPQRPNAAQAARHWRSSRCGHLSAFAGADVAPGAIGPPVPA